MGFTTVNVSLALVGQGQWPGVMAHLEARLSGGRERSARSSQPAMEQCARGRQVRPARHPGIDRGSLHTASCGATNLVGDLSPRGRGLYR
jgi:hypothetical protein